MVWWMVVAMILSANGGKFRIVNLAPHCNQVLNTDWNDPNSFAGLVPGERWVLGVPFSIVDPVLNNGKASVRDAEVPVNAPANFVFALIANPNPNARLVLQFEDGKIQEISLADAVPVIIAHPPLYSWHLDMIAIRTRQELKGEGRVIKAIR
ncbi:MAG: hypothetical protein ACK4I8_10995, partial [Armatimonadota bacterium]